MKHFQAAVERILVDPQYHDLLSLIKTARNGAVFGSKARFPHALVNTFLFSSGTFQEKTRTIFHSTKEHATRLAAFAVIYKIVNLSLRYGRNAKRAKAPYDSFVAGSIGGFVVFGQNQKGKISSISQQIVIYVFSRVAMALAGVLFKRGAKLPDISKEPIRYYLTNRAWTMFAAMSWGLVMLLADHYPEELQPSIRKSAAYIYQDCDSWDSLSNWIWRNK